MKLWKNEAGWKPENLPHCGVMSNTEVEKQRPSRGSKSICVPFASEVHYQECMNDTAQYRTYLRQVSKQHPELFPQALGQGYTFHDCYRSRKQEVKLRRIKLTSTAEVFTLRPSFLLPYGSARTEEVEKALYLRQWGVPFDALAYVFGRNAMFWYRAWLSLGRPNLVGTTVKNAAQMPLDLVADEKITWLAGEEVVVPTTVGGGCVRASVSRRRPRVRACRTPTGSLRPKPLRSSPSTRRARCARTGLRRRGTRGGRWSPSSRWGSVAKLIVTVCYLQLVVFFSLKSFNIWYRS